MKDPPFYRILMFAPAFAPFANPEAIVNSKLALSFVDAGWEIDIITRNLAEESEYNYGSEWIEPWLPLKDITHTVFYKLEGKFRRYFETFWASMRVGYPIEGCRWALHALNIALRLHRQKPYQIILSRSGPDAAHLPAMILARKTGLPWLANWNDPSGDKMPPPHGQGVNARLAFSYDFFLKKVAKEATYHTFPSERLKKYVCQYLGNDITKKTSTIPHIAMKQYKVNNRRKNEIFTICLAGKFYPGRNPDVFFQGLTKFLKKKRLKAKVKLIIIGLIDMWLIKLLEEYSLKTNVIITGPQSYKDTLRYLRESDVLLVIEAPYENGIFLPSKFVDYVQAGRPILAVSPLNGTLNDIISTHGGGIAVDCCSSEKIADSLAELHYLWKKNTIDDKYSSDQLYHLFSPKTIIESYIKIFKHIGVE